MPRPKAVTIVLFLVLWIGLFALDRWLFWSWLFPGPLTALLFFLVSLMLTLLPLNDSFRSLLLQDGDLSRAGSLVCYWLAATTGILCILIVYEWYLGGA